MSVPRTASSDGPILKVTDFGVDFFVDGTWIPAASGITYEVQAGEILAIVGESGSGKSSSSMALLGLMASNGRATGSVQLRGTEITDLNGPEFRKIRGKQVAAIFQEPMTALNPVYTIGFQIIESLRTHWDMNPRAARARAIELLAMVEIPNPEVSVDKYPHQMSGGQRQRAMIAMAISCDPLLLIADEPTTALDVTVQAEILDLLRNLRRRLNSAIILITHDMGVVADLADSVIVMKDGRIVERGAVEEIFSAATHPYTRELLAAVPRLNTRAPSARGNARDAARPAAAAVLSLENVSIEYPGRGRVPAVRVVRDASFEVLAGEIVGVVGESGSGKTTIGKACVGLLPIAEGTLTVRGTNLATASASEMRALRRKIGIVFQDPGSSLNPRFPIGQSIGEPLALSGEYRSASIERRVEELLDQVQLPKALRNRYPHQLSGGQRQRVGIARALALRPALLIADEPTSALDVSVQARFIELLGHLQSELRFACLFVSHDLAVVDRLAHRIIVMHNGVVVEQGTTDTILRRPQHSYTQALIAAVPIPDPAAQRERRSRRLG